MDKTVLIVDDSRLNRFALKNFFMQLNYTKIEQAKTIEIAKKIFLDKKPQIVTIDQILPGSNGTEFAKYLNSYDVINGVKTFIIFVTANPLTDSEKFSIKANVYLLKPATKNKIKMALQVPE